MGARNKALGATRAHLAHQINIRNTCQVLQNRFPTTVERDFSGNTSPGLLFQKLPLLSFSQIFIPTVSGELKGLQGDPLRPMAQGRTLPSTLISRCIRMDFTSLPVRAYLGSGVRMGVSKYKWHEGWHDGWQRYFWAPSTAAARGGGE